MPIPTPNAGESRDDYAARCIPTQINEGKDQAQAAAICFSTFDRHQEEAVLTQAFKLSKLMPPGPEQESG